MNKPSLVLVAALGLFGCSNNAGSGLQLGDLALPNDLLLPPPTLPDMATSPFTGGQQAKFSSSSMTMPKNATTYGYDLDGDGTSDNRLGSVMSALSALGMDPQASATAAVQQGSILFLFNEDSSDPTQQNDPAAEVTLNLGNEPALPPKYDGTDVFTVASTSMPSKFTGKITGGVFDSAPSATATTPVTATLVLPLVPAAAPLVLPVTGCHVTFTRNAAGMVTAGQLNGGIKKTDIDNIVIPALAAMLTTQIGASPAIAMFDTNMDGTITATELKGNALIANFLAPDVQLFQGGVYKPNPAKTTKDSLSIGVGFTGVPATF